MASPGQKLIVDFLFLTFNLLKDIRAVTYFLDLILTILSQRGDPLQKSEDSISPLMVNITRKTSFVKYSRLQNLGISVFTLFHVKSILYLHVGFDALKLIKQNQLI